MERIGGELLYPRQKNCLFEREFFFGTPYPDDVVVTTSSRDDMTKMILGIILSVDSLNDE